MEENKPNRSLFHEFEKKWAVETGDQAIDTLRSRFSHQPTPLVTQAILVLFWDMFSKETTKTGFVHLPIQKPLCVRDMMACDMFPIVTCNDTHVTIQTSWGKEWGDNGCAHIPLDYFRTNLIGLSGRPEPMGQILYAKWNV